VLTHHKSSAGENSEEEEFLREGFGKKRLHSAEGGTSFLKYKVREGEAHDRFSSKGGGLSRRDVTWKADVTNFKGYAARGRS